MDQIIILMDYHMMDRIQTTFLPTVACHYFELAGSQIERTLQTLTLFSGSHMNFRINDITLGMVQVNYFCSGAQCQ